MDTGVHVHATVKEVFENRGVDIDMDMDTALNRCPPYSGRLYSANADFGQKDHWLVSNFIPTDSKKFEFQNFK